MSRTVRLAIVGMLLTGLIAAAGTTDRFLRAPIMEGETIVILLIGGDDGPFRGGSVLRSRADALQLLVVSPGQRSATLLSIPRDSWVHVPGRGSNRINTCLLNGPQRCVETVESVWGIEVDHYLLTDFNGLRTAVNAVGGVVVDVPHVVRDGGTSITQTGRQRITGEQALAYTRDRKTRPGGDFARSAAQANLLQEAHRELVESSASIPRIVDAAAQLQRATISDLRPDQLLRYAFLAMTIDPSSVNQITLPARHGRAGAAAVVFLQPTAREIVREVTADSVLGAGEDIVPGDG